MKPKQAPSIFDPTDEADDDKAMVEAEADLAAGRVISHEAISRWLRSWRTSNELPPPKCGG